MRWLLLLAACNSSSPTAPAPAEPLNPPATPSIASVSPGVELPEVPLHGFDRADGTVAAIAVSPTSLTLAGKQLLALRDGIPDPAELENGVQGMLIPRLQQALGSRPSGDRVLLGIDRRVPYRTLIEVVYTASRTGAKKFGVLARSGAHTMAVPIALPDRSPSSMAVSIDRVRAGSAGDEPPLRLFVSVAKDKILLWSIAGQEGTLQKPKLTVDRASKTAVSELSAVLAEIVARRWPGGNRGELDRSIVLQADNAVPMQLIAELLGAVRATPEGKVLFPDVLLASGFE